MQRISWVAELRLLSLLFFFALLMGWAVGYIPWALFVAAVFYIIRTLRQIILVQRWLRAEDDSDPPASTGLWGDVLDGIHRLQLQNRKERQRLQGVVDYLRDSLASLTDAVVMVDKSGNIEWSNQAARQLLGLCYPEDVGQPLLGLIRSPEFIRYFEIKDYQSPLEAASPYLREQQLQFQLTFFGKGSRLLFARDITHAHMLQEMRKDFVGNVSHELRTPLTVVNGYLETFADSEFSSDKRYKRAIDQMLQQVHRMGVLVKDLITLARLESVADETDQSRVNVCGLLHLIREEVLAVFDNERDIHLECDSTIELRGDSEELRSAFTNLIMNAAKYTGEGGQIFVRFYADKNHAWLSVEDDGIGIMPHHIPRLTERFYRVDKSRSTHTGGTGLGLAIVKHVLMRHHGELRISSQVGVGSTFSCCFSLGQTV